MPFTLDLKQDDRNVNIVLTYIDFSFLLDWEEQK